MSAEMDWPTYFPRPSLAFTINSGTLTLDVSSAVQNPGDFVWGTPNQLSASLWKNGSWQRVISINSSTGALTMSSLSVTTGDHIEVRFVSDGYADVPWKSNVLNRRIAFFDIETGVSAVTFDDSTNVMPIPAWSLAFGWSTFNKLKVGFKVAGDDSASQDMTVTTRRGVGVDETSTTIDLDDTSTTQTHTSSFAKTDVAAGVCAVQTLLKSGAGTTRIEDSIQIEFTDKDEVPSYPSAFPSSGTLLTESVDSSRLRLSRP